MMSAYLLLSVFFQIQASMFLGLCSAILSLLSYMLTYRANSKTSARRFQLIGYKAVRPWNPATNSFPPCTSPGRSGTAYLRGQRFSLTVKLVCSFISQIHVQTLLQLESSSLIVTTEGRCPVLFRATF